MSDYDVQNLRGAGEEWQNISEEETSESELTHLLSEATKLSSSTSSLGDRKFSTEDDILKAVDSVISGVEEAFHGDTVSATDNKTESKTSGKSQGSERGEGISKSAKSVGTKAKEGLLNVGGKISETLGKITVPKFIKNIPDGAKALFAKTKVDLEQKPLETIEEAQVVEVETGKAANLPVEESEPKVETAPPPEKREMEEVVSLVEPAKTAKTHSKGLLDTSAQVLKQDVRDLFTKVKDQIAGMAKSASTFASRLGTQSKTEGSTVQAQEGDSGISDFEHAIAKKGWTVAKTGASNMTVSGGKIDGMDATLTIEKEKVTMTVGKVTTTYELGDLLNTNSAVVVKAATPDFSIAKDDGIGEKYLGREPQVDSFVEGQIVLGALRSEATVDKKIIKEKGLLTDKLELAPGMAIMTSAGMWEAGEGKWGDVAVPQAIIHAVLPQKTDQEKMKQVHVTAMQLAAGTSPYADQLTTSLAKDVKNQVSPEGFSSIAFPVLGGDSERSAEASFLAMRDHAKNPGNLRKVNMLLNDDAALEGCKKAILHQFLDAAEEVPVRTVVQKSTQEALATTWQSARPRRLEAEPPKPTQPAPPLGDQHHVTVKKSGPPRIPGAPPSWLKKK